MLLRPQLSCRDAFHFLLGALTLHLWAVFLQHMDPDTGLNFVSRFTSALPPPPTYNPPLLLETTVKGELPHTAIEVHAPGWTVFRDVYMANGTFFIVARPEDRAEFPPFRMITSTGLPTMNTPESIALREPTRACMDFISPEEAEARWGRENKMSTLEGNTVFFNDPSQFLLHYYHFVAELFFGLQAIWQAAFNDPITPDAQRIAPSLQDTPALHRVIFAHAEEGWRDVPGFNAYFLRGVFPSLSVESPSDWDDRIKATALAPSASTSNTRAFHFPTLFFVDRSAACRGILCASRTQRVASESWDAMRLAGKLKAMHAGGWWAPVREALWRFAGVDDHTVVKMSDIQNTEWPEPFDWNDNALKEEANGASVIEEVGPETQEYLPMPKRVVISYISRQNIYRRKLVQADHEGLVMALQELVERRNAESRKGRQGDGRANVEWELQVLEADKMSKDDQVKAAARTTILLGIHGNGLTHLVFMPPTRVSTVIEIFYPGGFAHDYQWTTRALGMGYASVWNDTFHPYSHSPRVAYPEGFQLDYIPVHGPTVANLIEARIDGKA